MLTPLWQVSSKDVASIIGPSRTCIVPRSGVTGCSAGRADSPFALSSRPTPPPPPPPEWMDPDVHDVGHHPQLAAAPSAVEAVIEAAAAQAGDLKLSSAFVAGSGSADVRTLALPLGVAWRSHVFCFQARRRGTKQVAAAPSSVALESSFTRQSSEVNRMSLSQALQVPLSPLC